jgi:hypothetical protein
MAIVTFLSALSLGSQDLSWTDPLILSLVASSVTLGSLFIVWEVKFAFEPIFPPALVIQRDVATSYAIAALQTAAQLSVRSTSSLTSSSHEGIKFALLTCGKDALLRPALLPRHH